MDDVEARERLARHVRAALAPLVDEHPATVFTTEGYSVWLRSPIDAILATTDALAALVPATTMLAAYERAGKVEIIDRSVTGCSKCGCDHVSVTFNYDVPWGPDDDRRPDWTDPEAAP